MAKWPNILGRADNEALEDNVAPFPSLERDAQPTRPQRTEPWPYPSEPMRQPPPQPAEHVDLLPKSIRHEITVATEMFAELHPLDRDARKRIMDMLKAKLDLYAKDDKPEHPEGSPV